MLHWVNIILLVTGNSHHQNALTQGNTDTFSIFESQAIKYTSTDMQRYILYNSTVLWQQKLVKVSLYML